MFRSVNILFSKFKFRQNQCCRKKYRWHKYAMYYFRF